MNTWTRAIYAMLFFTSGYKFVKLLKVFYFFECERESFYKNM